MGAPLALTFPELVESLRGAAPRTSDDVTITGDGRRIDSAEKARAWIAEVNAERAREAEQAKASGGSTT